MNEQPTVPAGMVLKPWRGGFPICATISITDFLDWRVVWSSMESKGPSAATRLPDIVPATVMARRAERRRRG